MAFDCLYVDGRDLHSLALRERRAELERVLENDQVVLFPARPLADNELKAWQQVLDRGYEGFIAKDDSALYRGGRSLAWLKVKQRKYPIEERGWDPGSKP